MFAYDVENELATFRRISDRLGATANAAPGAFVAVLPPNERNRRRSRKVEVRASTSSFMMDVPYDLGRDLRTVLDGSPDLVKNLARCFECAYIATISRDMFVALRLEDAWGSYENHQLLMRSEGYEGVAHDLKRGLGEENYRSLIEALRRDLGFEDAGAKQTAIAVRVESRKPASAAGQPLVLFTT